MMRHALGIAMIALVLIAGNAGEAEACSCMMSGPPCQAAWTADVVFAGTAKTLSRFERVIEHGVSMRLVRVTFAVERGFIGAAPGPLDVETAADGSACGYSFTSGEQYLVYAWKMTDGRLTTGICSRTRKLANAQEDLQYLSSMPPVGTGARVYGRVTEWRRDPFEERGVDYGPVEGLVVTARGATVSRAVSTDPDGRYQIAGLPPGKMTVTLAASPEFDSRAFEREIELKDPRACSLVDFQIQKIARAYGLVLDAGGRPLAGVAVDAVAAELAGAAPRPYQHPVKTDAHGRFEFDDLPPGEYVFGVNLTKEWYAKDVPGPPVFLPSTSNPAEAAVITLKAGERQDVGTLRLATGGVRELR